jgi:hypothetical protein
MKRRGSVPSFPRIISQYMCRQSTICMSWQPFAHSAIGERQAGVGMECENMSPQCKDFYFLLCWPSLIPVRGNGVCLPCVGTTAREHRADDS